ncbi:tyrosine-protein phosphatase [soil metagenome]
MRRQLKIVDIHVHLLAGLDDGPRTQEDAVEMCRMAYEDGTDWMCATAHQNHHYPDVTPKVIADAFAKLRASTNAAGLGELSLKPSAEIMADEDFEKGWEEGKHLSIGDHKKYLLVEMPDGKCYNLCRTIKFYAKQNLKVIIAHPERQPGLLYRDDLMEAMLAEGALVQVSAESVTHPKSKLDAKALRTWFKRDIVHFMGSDGHSPRRRLPLLGDAFDIVCKWIGFSAADRIFSGNGLKLVQGLPIKVPPIKPVQKKAWFKQLFSAR